MSRIISAAAALILTAVLTISGMILNTTTANEVSERISSAMESAKKEDIDSAEKTMKQLEAYWENRNGIMLVFTAHDKLDNIDESIKTAGAYLECGDNKMFIAECRRTLTLLDHFRDIEYPSLNNIF